ncbi:hypothetical protein Tco_1194962 [Tanacetum coccineum]
MARAVARNGQPKSIGILESSRISRTTKSMGRMNLSIFISTSSAIPHGYWMDLSASSKLSIASSNLALFDSRPFRNLAYLGICARALVNVLGGNYFSTEQVNSIQQLLAYYLITGTEKDSMFPLPFSGKKKKLKSQTVTPTLPKSQGPEASESLPQKRKKPLSKKAPKATPPQTNEGLPSTLDEGTRKSQSLPEGTTTDPEDPGGNDQPTDKGLPSTASNEGTAKIMPCTEGPLRDKDSEGNIPPADMEPINPTITDPLGTGAEYQVDKTQSTRLRYQTLTENKGKTSSKVDPGLQTLQFTTFADIQAYLLSEDELNQESDEEEVFAAGDDMEEETQADEEEHQSPSPNKDKPEPSHTPTTQESDSDSSSPDLKKFDNILPLTERQLAQHEEDDVSYADLMASIEGYYEENINHREQTDKLDTVKYDHVLSKKDIEATKAYTKNSSTLTELLSLAAIKSDISSLKQDTSVIKSMMSEIYQAFKGQASTPLSSVPLTTLAITELPATVGGIMIHRLTLKNLLLTLRGSISPLTDPILEIPTEVQPITTIISTSQPEPSVPKREGKAIATDDQPEVQTKLVPASKEVRPDPDAPILIKKDTEEAKLFKMTKTEVIKVVQEEAEKIRLDPKTIISAKAGEKIKKAQDAKHQVLKSEHSQKAKRAMELRKKRFEQYIWTTSSGLRLEPITDVKIHPNSKPAVLTFYRANDKRNFQVHNPFKFADFGVTELDELGPIIQKKKNTIVKDLMTFLGKRYERLKKIPEELGIQSALPVPVPEQAPSESSVRKRKHMELKPEIKILRLECNRSLHEGVLFVNNMVIEEPEYGIFFTDVFDDIMESVISCETAKATWTDLAKPTESLSQTYTRYKTLINELANDGVNLSRHEINVGFVNREVVNFSQVLRNANHTQTLDLADIYGRSSKEYLRDLDIEFHKRSLLANSKHEKEVLDDEEVTQVKVLMALADDELTVRKNHARNGEWIDITMRKNNSKRRKKINEKWLTSSKKVSQCISEQIPHQKKKVLEMIPKSKAWVKRLNPDSKLPNFKTGRILIPKSQDVNESLKPTDTSITPEPSKDSEAEFPIPLPPLKSLQVSSPSSEVMTLTFQPHSLKERPGLGSMKHTKPKTQDSLNKSASGNITVSETEPTTPLIPTKVKDTKQESKINELTKLV